MDPIIGGAIIGGAANIIGGIFGDSSAKKAAARAAAANERQLKNQHQWEVQDLRKAGLNPILSGTGGGGSGTISTPVAQTGQTGKAIAESAALVAQLKLMNAQTENVKADTGKKAAETAATVINAQGMNYKIDEHLAGKPYWDQLAVYGKDRAKYGVIEQKTAIQEAKARITNLDLGAGSARLNQRRERVLVEALEADPRAAAWINSASYEDFKILDRVVEGDWTASNVLKAMKSIMR